MNGTIDIQTPEVDPSKGLIEVSDDLVDSSKLIAQGCSVGKDVTARQLSEFIITGRGGLPANPTEVIGSDAVLTS
ncbi:MAG: hypothetical protein ACRDEA_01715 [Microcystaceae cyanobacterium]